MVVFFFLVFFLKTASFFLYGDVRLLLQNLLDRHNQKQCV